ncbi:metal/formaldehyde-sensitive transcriptional repressor [Paracoccus nototheniae]|uniref:Metal/formaldehyde-sensitive transcriptional repressor n=1 Tax=Paracoccus nototheniae TaxID=2489002 RepID=A0ABW4DT44_9RHOB|nr:metal/formaldehyde-sensitive transcriptional repressor [Paracoccus nototheniae]
MTHTIKNKSALLARIRRLRGQMDAVERMLDADAPCAEVLNLVASIRGATSGLTLELIEEHIRGHVADPDTDKDAERAKAAGELIGVIRTYLK